MRGFFAALKNAALFLSEVEGEVLGGGGAGAGGFFEGDFADVEGALDVLVAFEEVFDGEELEAGVLVPSGEV